jgi:uncharacterized protein YxeA
MKKLVVILLCLAVASLAVAGQFKIKDSIRPDPLRGENHYLIYNKSGKAEARIAPDPIRSNQYQIFDKNGNQTGRIKPDAIRQDRWIIETVKD